MTEEEIIRKNVRRQEIANKVMELSGKVATYTQIAGKQNIRAIIRQNPLQRQSLPRSGRDINKSDKQDAYILEVIDKNSEKKEITKLTYEIDKNGEATLDMDESRTIVSKNDEAANKKMNMPTITFFANENEVGIPEQSDRIVIEYNGYRLGIDVGQAKSLNSNVSDMKFDFLLLTHFDVDHIGDKWNEDRAANMIEDGRVAFAMFGNTRAKTDAGHEFLASAALNAKEGKIGAIAHGARTGDDGQFLQRKVFLGDHKELIGKSGQIDYTKAREGKANGIFIETLGPHREHKAMNNNSIITKITCPNLTILSLGDAEVDALKDMYDYAHREGISLKCDILKLPHHGSYTCINESGCLDEQKYQQLFDTFMRINKQYVSYEDARKRGGAAEAELYKEFIIARIIKEANPRVCSVCCSHTDPKRLKAGKINSQVIDVCKKMNKPLKRTSRSGNITSRALGNGFVEVTEQKAALKSKQYSGNTKDENIAAVLKDVGKKVTVYNEAGMDVDTKIYSKDERFFCNVSYDIQGKEVFGTQQVNPAFDSSAGALGNR